MSKKKVLLFQVRDSEETRLHEQQCFVDVCGPRGAALRFYDLLQDPDVEWKRIESFGAILIGGAGAHSAVEDHLFTQPFTELLLRWIDSERPVFGSCWGHHFLAKALGGEVVHDRSAAEVGSFPVTLTSDGETDPLFETMPRTFIAQLGHHDRVAKLPEEAAELAFSKVCGNQAFRLRGLPVWGTQFHSELDAASLLDRLHMYSGEYLGQERAPTEVIDAIRPSPHVRLLLRRFLDLVL